MEYLSISRTEIKNTDAEAVLDKKLVLAYSLTHMFGHLSEGISCVHSFILHAEDTIVFYLLTDVTTEHKEQKAGGLRGPAKGTAASSSLFSRSGKLSLRADDVQARSERHRAFPCRGNPPCPSALCHGSREGKGGGGRGEGRKSEALPSHRGIYFCFFPKLNPAPTGA